jgi:hypothetical protein
MPQHPPSHPLCYPPYDQDPLSALSRSASSQGDPLMGGDPTFTDVATQHPTHCGVVTHSTGEGVPATLSDWDRYHRDHDPYNISWRPVSVTGFDYGLRPPPSRSSSPPPSQMVSTNLTEPLTGVSSSQEPEDQDPENPPSDRPLPPAAKDASSVLAAYEKLNGLAPAKTLPIPAIKGRSASFWWEIQAEGTQRWCIRRSGRERYLTLSFVRMAPTSTDLPDSANEVAFRLSGGSAGQYRKSISDALFNHKDGKLFKDDIMNGLNPAGIDATLVLGAVEKYFGEDFERWQKLMMGSER